MFTDLDDTLRRLLEDELLPLHRGEIDLSFEQPTRDWSSRLNKPTLNLFLYDVRENNQLRQHQWQTPRNGNGRQKQRSPFRYDCHYILTGWVKKDAPNDEHDLLGLGMEALLRHPTLPTDYLVGRLRRNDDERAPGDQPVEIQTHVGSHDKLTNPAELWSALDNEIRPTISYMVTIAVNPWRPTDLEPPVRTVRLGLLPDGEPSALQTHVSITGEAKQEVEQKDEEKGEAVIVRRSISYAEIILTPANEEAGWHYVAQTDKNGRYRVRSIVPGSYELAVWQTVGNQQRQRLGQRQIIVPPSVLVVRKGERFDLTIRPFVTLEGLSLNPEDEMYVETADLGDFWVREVGHALPETGVYHFGRPQQASVTPLPIPQRTDQEQPPVAQIISQNRSQPSFEVTYRQEDQETRIGNYDVLIPATHTAAA